MTVFAATTPAMPTRDVERALAFYEAVLGFEPLVHEGDFALLRRDGTTVSLWGATDVSWRERTEWEQPVCSGAESFIAGTASFRLQVEGIDELDPDGNLIGFWEERA